MCEEDPWVRFVEWQKEPAVVVVAEGTKIVIHRAATINCFRDSGAKSPFRVAGSNSRMLIVFSTDSVVTRSGFRGFVSINNRNDHFVGVEIVEQLACNNV